MNVSNANMNINQVLNQIRVRSQYLDNIQQPASETQSFSSVLQDSISKVNALQTEAGNLKTAFERGDAGIDLPEVMLAGQKASLSFEAVVEVRNRVLNAYQEIMNMQV